MKYWLHVTLDLTVTAKLHFFKCIAHLFHEFLVSFQSYKPVIPFLSSLLENAIKTIMKMFVFPHDRKGKHTAQTDQA